VFGACFEQQLLLTMSAPLHSADRHRASMVAIIGNDTVLEAAPATPVQLAHACLRRGFAVAVPASWGDELVASETVRRLASRERGPAVMCVCPFVRSRLLAPGPDLAPFLVSLVAPPVATARYLRAAYGERGVHITYIGGCPSAEDPSIDGRLTPDAFLADLAEHGIALAEQPLVFDSIIPPDRRRWCSLPGGTPTAETLWSESDTRTLVEIDRDDVSTDLAQHIVTHEHVLLDLAPGLGCVCSGAVRSSPSRTARAAVIAVEPPRAPKSVVEPAPVVSLDVPVAELVTSPPLVAVGPSGAVEEESSLESRLDELLGRPIDRRWIEVEPEIEVGVEFTVETATVGFATAEMRDRAPTATASAPQTPAGSAATRAELAEAVSDRAIVPQTVPEPEATPSIVPTPESTAEPVAAPSVAEPAAPATAERSRVRRNAPGPMPVRYPSSAIPRAIASDGKALPRAYVAKRPRR
jgi:iron only hydrogenase large subunit